MMLMTIFKLATFLAVSTLAVKSNQPVLSKEAELNYDNHREQIRFMFPVDIRPTADVTIPELYPHYIGGDTAKESQAWRFSQDFPFGPAHVTFGAHGNRYITTRIPWDSKLGGNWGLRQAHYLPDDEITEERIRDYKDLYAFWRMRKDRTIKLLRLDAWPAGGGLSQIMAWGLVHR
ncbi:uncharacterized protein SPSC_06086 [Sporisorium scitamineum]|uniref:Uncharacterized protein n=1 Tax=Sporisorium scitamineum TaxID=49012 RepID=A0A0F7S744_9BASI|nr:uncharacterized protein SPSC_06086 [Sporisorium scitamineum]CDW97084.1 hypothetical protein [Sporisorium scitamineum]